MEKKKSINYVWSAIGPKKNVPLHHLKNIRDTAIKNANNAAVNLYYDHKHSSDKELNNYIKENNQWGPNKRSRITFKNAREAFDAKDEVSKSLKKTYQAEIQATKPRGAIVGNPLKLQLSQNAARKGEMAIVSDAGIPVKGKINFNRLEKDLENYDNLFMLTDEYSKNINSKKRVPYMIGAETPIVFTSNPKLTKEQQENYDRSFIEDFGGIYNNPYEYLAPRSKDREALMERLRPDLSKVKSPEDLVKYRQDNAEMLKNTKYRAHNVDSLLTDGPIDRFYVMNGLRKRIRQSPELLEQFDFAKNKHSQSWKTGPLDKGIKTAQQYEEEAAIETFDKHKFGNIVRNKLLQKKEEKKRQSDLKNPKRMVNNFFPSTNSPNMPAAGNYNTQRDNASTLALKGSLRRYPNEVNKKKANRNDVERKLYKPKRNIFMNLIKKK